MSRLLKLAVENGIDFEKMVLKQAKAAYEKQSAVDALTDEDDDDEDEDEDEEEETPKARKGKAAPKAKAVEEDEDDDDDEDEEEEDEEEDENDEDDEDEDEEDEEEDDEDDEDEEEDDDDEEEAGDASEIDAETFAVVSTSESDETITVKIDGKSTKLWLGEGIDIDWDAIKKGVEITVSALQDDEGDWVLTSVKKKRAARAKAATK
jgi:hypothetical protein